MARVHLLISQLPPRTQVAPGDAAYDGKAMDCFLTAL